MSDPRRIASLALLCALLLVAGSARAAFHLMKIVEVFPGTAAAPNAQYVVLQMYAGSQNFVNGHGIVVSDASGSAIGTFPFTSNVATGTTQSKILIATAEAEAFFGIAADLPMTAVLPLAGGKVCFDAIDCVAWGRYAPPVADPRVGTAFHSDAAPVAAQPGRGLIAGRAIGRRLDIVAPTTTLQALDDTNDSANDFAFAAPAPRNNAGQNGSVPDATCGDGAITGLEDCDDGGATSGDGCSALCIDEFCGDLAANDVNELCDDGNAISGDGCDANCTLTGCGNAILTAGEACETPGTGVCTARCALTAEVAFVDWTSPTSGTAAGREATLQSIVSSAIDSADLSSASYLAAPAPPDTEVLAYDTGSDWSLAISQPAASLLLHTVSWRGTGGGADPVTYDFDVPFSIVSGLDGALVEDAGRRLVLPAESSFDGVLLFAGPISSLSVDVNSTSSAQQAMAVALVPEPAKPLGVALGTLAALRIGARRRALSARTRPGAS